MGVKISELTEANSVADNDVLPIVQSGETKKVSKQTFLSTIINLINQKEQNINAQIEELKTVVLYDDNTGSNGDIILSDSAANYTYLEIFYRNNDNNYSSVKIYSPNNKKVSLLNGSINYTSTENMRSFIKQRTINISGTSITTAINNSVINAGDVKITNSATTVTPSGTNNIYITRVIGYLI